MDAINTLNDEVNAKVNGTVTLEMYKGTVNVVSIKSQFGLQHASFNNGGGYKFNVNASAGFTEIHTLQMKIANGIAKTLKPRRGGMPS
jgi:argininosuccinate synthase